MARLYPRRAPAAAGVAKRRVGGDSTLMMTMTLQAVVGDDGVLLSRQLNHHETRYQITEKNEGPKIWGPLLQVTRSPNFFKHSRR